MKNKINRRFMSIAIFSIIVTTVTMALIFYGQLEKQVFSDLSVMADLVTYNVEHHSENMVPDKVSENVRITLVDPDGTVTYDSSVDANTMVNHLDRPEIRDAIDTGTGQVVRESDTMSESIFYYAERLTDGRIVRVGKESHSVLAVMLSTLPFIIVMILILTIICMITSRFLTKIIIKPIDEMVEDLDHIDENLIYDELRPFARKIRTQHAEILEVANLRQEFTANVSHELKTPLAAISGYAELMESGMVKDAEVMHFSKEIRKSAERLLNLINDIINLSKLDSGDTESVLEVVDLAQIARDTVNMLSINASQNDVKVTYEGLDNLNVRLGKEYALELTYNLVQNAIRYNKIDGAVKVSVTQSNGSSILTVEDTGIGIEEQELDRVFERFYRVDKSRSKELGGTGLGLAIVKHICNLTNGDISVDSEIGNGTTFKIEWK